VASLSNPVNPDSLVKSWLKKGLAIKLQRAAIKGMKESLTHILSQDFAGDIQNAVAKSLQQGKLLVAASYFNQYDSLSKISSLTIIIEKDISKAAAYLIDGQESRKGRGCERKFYARPGQKKPAKKTSKGKTSPKRGAGQQPGRQLL
jgi:hypothetical protein